MLSLPRLHSLHTLLMGLEVTSFTKELSKGVLEMEPRTVAISYKPTNAKVKGGRNRFMSQTEKVIRYYRTTGRDYQKFWMSSDSLAMHFGYYDETVSTHEASLLKMNEVMACYAHITSQDRLLDAGCG